MHFRPGIVDHGSSTMTETKVRIFVSSPSDVERERALVRDIIVSLAQEYRPYFQVQPVLWKEEALTAAQSFQAGLLRPADCGTGQARMALRLSAVLCQCLLSDSNLPLARRSEVSPYGR